MCSSQLILCMYLHYMRHDRYVDTMYSVCYQSTTCVRCVTPIYFVLLFFLSMEVTLYSEHFNLCIFNVKSMIVSSLFKSHSTRDAFGVMCFMQICIARDVIFFIRYICSTINCLSNLPIIMLTKIKKNILWIYGHEHNT